MSGPTIGYTWIQPHYVKETYIDRMDRVEDFDLGNEMRARTGYMARDLGSDQDRWIFNVADQQGLSLGEGRFALASAGFSGRVYDNRLENGLTTEDINFYWKNYIWTRTRTLVFHIEGAQGANLDVENQVILGGNTGLRGYKNDAFVGSRSILANLEDRFFFDGEYFHLVRFGGVMFAETGAVVSQGSGFSPESFRSDVGAGIRAGSSRSTSGSVARLDVAYALNGGPGGGSRWVISLTGGQAFGFFSSAATSVATSPGPGL
jgi:hemolysin activation/secretion protein